MRLAPSLVLALASLPALASSVLVVPTDEARVQGLGDTVVDVLTSAGLTAKLAGAKAPAVECVRQTDADARRTCLAEYATRATTATVLLLGASEQKKQLVGTVELISQATGKVLKSLTIRAPAAKWPQQAATQLKALKGPVNAQRYVAREVARELPVEAAEERAEEPSSAEATPPIAAKPEQPEPARDERAERPEVERASDRPVDTRLTPVEDQPDVSLEESGPSRAGAWTATGISLAAAAVATTVGLMGVAGKSRLESAPNGLSTLSYGQATALKGAANTQLTVGLVAGLLALAAGTTAGLLWGLE